MNAMKSREVFCENLSQLEHAGSQPELKELQIESNKIEFTSRMQFFFFAPLPVAPLHTPELLAANEFLLQPAKREHAMIYESSEQNTFHSQEIKCCAIRVNDPRCCQFFLRSHVADLWCGGEMEF